MVVATMGFKSNGGQFIKNHVSMMLCIRGWGSSVGHEGIIIMSTYRGTTIQARFLFVCSRVGQTRMIRLYHYL